MAGIMTGSSSEMNRFRVPIVSPAGSKVSAAVGLSGPGVVIRWIGARVAVGPTRAAVLFVSTSTVTAVGGSGEVGTAGVVLDWQVVASPTASTAPTISTVACFRRRPDLASNVPAVCRAAHILNLNLDNVTGYACRQYHLTPMISRFLTSSGWSPAG